MRRLIIISVLFCCVIAIAQTAFLEAKNAAYSQLAAGIDDDDTEITVTTGHGDRFPDGTRDFHLALSNAEIVKCTARTGDVLTIVRAQEGTVAQAHLSGATVRLTVSAQYVSEIQTAVNDLETDWDAHPDLTEGSVLVGDANDDPSELSGTVGQVIKHNGTGWAAGTDTNTTYTDFTGDSGSGGVAGLVPAPGAGDAAAGKYLKASGGWATPPDTNTTYTAGTGLNLSTNTFSLSHLSLQLLADPDADRLFFWDDSESASKWLELGTNLSITGTTLNASGGGSLPAGTEHYTLRYDDPNGWEQAGNLVNTGTTVIVSGSGNDTYPLDITHSSNAAANDEVGISFTSWDPDGRATPTIGSVGFEIEAVSATDILDADFVVKTKQSGGAVTERFRVADTTLTDSSGMLKQAAIEQNSATTGQALVWGGSAWAPGSVASFPAGATNTTLRYSDTNTVANTDKFEIDSSGNITADGTITAGSGPVTITNASGKVLMSALEKTTYSVVDLNYGYMQNAVSTSWNLAYGGYTQTGDNDAVLTWRGMVPSDYKTGGAIIFSFIVYPESSATTRIGYSLVELADGGTAPSDSFAYMTWNPGSYQRYIKRTYTWSTGVSGLVAGDMFYISFTRTGTHASDTNTSVISLYGPFTIEFER